MTTLLTKELRQLLPIATFWLMLIAFGYLTQLAGARIDEQSFGSWCAEYCQPGLPIGNVLFYIVLVLITAYSLFPREYDESTMDFLRSLPVTAGQIFLAKLLAAWLLLCCLSISGYLLDASLLSLNPQSIDGRSYPITALQFLLRDCLFLFIILAHGIFISWFRTVGLILYVGYLAVIVWVETQLGSAGVWNVLRVLENEYEGQRLVVNGALVATHVIVAMLLLSISFRLWRGQETSRRGKSRTRRVPPWLAVLGNTTAFVVLAALLLGYLNQTTRNSADADPIEKSATRHYRFTFGENQRQTMRYLSQHADADLERLATLLGSDTQLVIDTDLTTKSDHLLGLAQWKRINMDVSGFLTDEKYRRVLSHETVHVFQAVDSDRALADYGNATRFFIEGMAQYVSFRLVPEPERLKWNRRLAAVAWQRQRIRFDDLINDAAFGQRFDADLYYSLGELWTASLVDACGEQVLGRILRAAGREGASKSLSGAAFWRDTLQVADCELESVNARWRQQMQARFDAVEQDAFPAFENVRIDLSTSGDTLVVRADITAANDSAANDSKVNSSGTLPDSETPEGQGLAGSGPTRWQMRIAGEAGLANAVPRLYYGKRTEDAGTVTIEYRIPRAALSGSRFRYQLGYTPHADSRSYFERWQAASVTGGR